MPEAAQPTAPESGMTPDGRVFMRGLDGGRYSLPPGQVLEAQQLGYHIETPEEAAHSAAAAKAKQAGGAGAFAGSLTQTLPFIGGPLEKARRALTGTTDEEAEAEAEMHPLARTAGTVVGAGAQAAAIAGSGGLEGGAEAAGLLSEESGLVAKTAVKALAGGIEGAGYSAGGAVNEAVLTNHPLTAEMLLQQAGGGALFGGVLAGGLSLAGEGLEAMAEHAKAAGNAARGAHAADMVGEDLGALADKGLTPGVINRAFKEGIFDHEQTVPTQVQAKVAQRMAEVQQEITQVAAKLDQSGQTFDLLKMVQKASDKAINEGEGSLRGLIKGGLLTDGDEVAPIARVLKLRQSLLGVSEDPAAAGLLKRIDSAISDRAGNVSKSLGETATTSLETQRDFLHPLARLADEAVVSGHMPTSATKAFESMGRQGGHLNAIQNVASMAGLIHPGAGFLGLAAGNLLGKVVRNPGGIAETFLGGLTGIAKATRLSHEEMNLAVQAAVEGTHHLSGHLAEVLNDKLLKHDATDGDVDKIRTALAKAEQHNLANGHPAIASAVNVQRSILAQALPLPKGNTNAPKALARPNLGPTGKEITAYNSTLRVLANPYGTLARVGQGKATAAEIRTLGQAYPQLSQRAGALMLNAAAARGKAVSPAAKRAIETLHATSFDPATVGPKVMRVQQIAFAPKKAPGGASPGGAGPGVNAKGLASLDLGDRISHGMVKAADESKGRR